MSINENTARPLWLAAMVLAWFVVEYGQFRIETKVFALWQERGDAAAYDGSDADWQAKA